MDQISTFPRGNFREIPSCRAVRKSAANTALGHLNVQLGQDERTITSTSMSLVHLLFHFGLPAIAVLIGLENLGVPLPTEAAYIVAQALITRQHTPYLLVLAVLQAAHFFGSWLSYELGRRLRHSRAVTEVEPNISAIQAKMSGWLHTYGLTAVIFSRLVGFVRPWSSYLAGAIDLPRLPFLAASFIGSLIFNIIALALTQTIVRFWERYPIARIGLSASFVLGFVTLIAIHIARKSAKKMAVAPTPKQQ